MRGQLSLERVEALLPLLFGQRLQRPRRYAELVHVDARAASRPSDLVRGDRSREPLQVHVLNLGRENEILDFSVHTLADQHLPSVGGIAEASCEVRHASDRGVVESAFEPDSPERRVPLCNPDGEAEVVSAATPGFSKVCDAVSHRDAHANRAD